MALFRILIATLLLVTAVGTAGILYLRAIDRPEDHQVVLTIPAGATRREAAGQPGVELPKAITLTLGLRDTLIIRNEDAFVARVGPFRMEPGQQYAQRFRRPGAVNLLCTTLYHADTIQVVVVDRRNPLQRWADDLVR